MAPLTGDEAGRYGAVVQVEAGGPAGGNRRHSFQEAEGLHLKQSEVSDKRNGFLQKLKHPLDLMVHFTFTNATIFVILYNTMEHRPIHALVEPFSISGSQCPGGFVQKIPCHNHGQILYSL